MMPPSTSQRPSPPSTEISAVPLSCLHPGVLMNMGFISLLLTLMTRYISRICILEEPPPARHDSALPHLQQLRAPRSSSRPTVDAPCLKLRPTTPAPKEHCDT